MSDTPRSSPGVRLPPPLIFLSPLVFAWWMNRRLPFLIVGDEGSPLWMWTVGVLMVAAGLALAVWALLDFFRARTNPLPHHPARALVIVAPYTFTRNPMYLGMTSMYLGVTLCKNWAWPVFCLPFVWWVMNAYVIAREERYLRGAFGAQYEAYCARVRRWL